MSSGVERSNDVPGGFEATDSVWQRVEGGLLAAQNLFTLLKLRAFNLTTAIADGETQEWDFYILIFFSLCHLILFSLFFLEYNKK
jgi:hypothetical protein